MIRKQMDSMRLIRISLTVLVPYVVSTVSSVSTALSMRNGDDQSSRG